ncbi:glutaredoxin [Mycena alexandri]|uniref:Glutaredoxin n=1 Tax=Mycena alexandri TaxID=1745969 RepID=A0AAD6XBZ2_9AGAR|nr:glutaredoxin [Mycena alexandri]
MSVQEIVDNAIDSHKITIFSKSWCPYCKKTKALFAAEFPDEEPYVLECARSPQLYVLHYLCFASRIDLRDDEDAIQDYLQSKTGQRSVPNVFVNKTQVGGNDKTQAAFKEGKLQELVNQ